MEKQKKRIAEYKARRKQTEELLLNANFADEDSEDEGLVEGAPDILDSYVEQLSREPGSKRPPPAVVWITYLASRAN